MGIMWGMINIIDRLFTIRFLTSNKCLNTLFRFYCFLQTYKIKINKMISISIIFLFEILFNFNNCHICPRLNILNHQITVVYLS